jgi:hypothetical protein
MVPVFVAVLPDFVIDKNSIKISFTPPSSLPNQNPMLSKLLVPLGLIATATLPFGQAVDCTSGLTQVQTGSTSDCSGGNVHTWPTGYTAEQCHGWQAEDNSGKTHDNSAKNMRCNEDGSFTFDQYAGNLVCSGSPVTKTMSSECEQDIPPSLYSKQIGAACGSTSGRPGVSQGGNDNLIYLDGVLCDDEDTPPAVTEAPTPAEADDTTAAPTEKDDEDIGGGAASSRVGTAAVGVMAAVAAVL